MKAQTIELFFYCTDRFKEEVDQSLFKKRQEIHIQDLLLDEGNKQQNTRHYIKYVAFFIIDLERL